MPEQEFQGLKRTCAYLYQSLAKHMSTIQKVELLTAMGYSETTVGEILAGTAHITSSGDVVGHSKEVK